MKFKCYRCKDKKFISAGAGRLRSCPLCQNTILNIYSYDKDGRLIDLETGTVYEK